jgi:hypothetical protein
MMGLLSGLFLLFCLICDSLQYTLQVHDASFVPDEILRVSTANVTNGCVERQSAMVNNSVPAPELRFKAGTVVWIRVWNDMQDANLTMVSTHVPNVLQTIIDSPFCSIGTVYLKRLLHSQMALHKHLSGPYLRNIFSITSLICATSVPVLTFTTPMLAFKL